MSGCRWNCCGFLLVLGLVTGCQSGTTGGLAWNPWNPFQRETTDPEDTNPPRQFPAAQLADDDLERDSEKSPTAKIPIATEQMDRLLTQGQIALQENRIEDARKAYDEVLSADPENATAHHGMAMVSDLSQKWSDAEYHYRQALRIKPQDANLLCDIGYSYLLQNRYSEASRYLDHAIKVNPNHENARMNLALLDLKQGNRAGAEQRVASWYGASARAQQVMAQLQKQAGVSPSAAVAAGGPAESSPVIPANATFEQIQEMARLERIQSEQSRMKIPGTANGDLGINPAMTGANVGIPQQLGTTNPAGPVSANGQSNVNQNYQSPPTWANAPGSPVAPSMNYVTSPQNQYSVAAQPGMPYSSPISAPAGGFPLTSVPPNSLPGQKPGTLPPGAIAYSDPRFQSQPNQSQVAQTQPLQTQPSGSAMQQPATQVAAAGSVTSAGAYSGMNHSPMNSSNMTVNGGRIVPVHASGSFSHPPTAPVSYGQPLGFANGSPGAMNSAGQYADSMPQSGQMQQNSGASAGFNGQMEQVPQNAGANPNGSYGQISPEGLNVGLGTPFPLGQPAGFNPAGGGSPAAGQGTPGNSIQFHHGSISSPGSYSMANGVSYGQPGAGTPGQGQQSTPSAGAGMNPGMAPQGSQNPSENPGSATAWPPAQPTQPMNPLEVYDRQRQQLDDQYNATLQQLDRNNPNRVPSAQY
jgi:Flp pilus assembly protein TadD